MSSVKMRHPKLIEREADAIEGMMDIEIMKMPPTLLNAIRNAGITKVEQLQYVSEDELYRIMRNEGLGCVAVDKVKEYLHFTGTSGAVMYDPNEK